jgi:hypothetical protein
MSLSPKGDDQWLERPEGMATGSFILRVTACFFGVLCGLFYELWWKHGVLGEGYVPDSLPLTLTFFGSVLASMALVRHTYRRA